MKGTTMTDREKLTEVIYSMDICSWDWAGKIADHLLANGVTFAKDTNVPSWIPVSERLPESIGLFLVIEKHWLDGSPCRRIAKWNTVDWFTADRKSREITPRVTHWMPLPTPPKEE